MIFDKFNDVIIVEPKCRSLQVQCVLLSPNRNVISNKIYEYQSHMIASDHYDVNPQYHDVFKHCNQRNSHS